MKSPMTKERLEEIRARCYVPTCADEDHMVARELIAALDAAVAEVHRTRDAYWQLAGCVGELDFGETEAEPPRTQRQWIKFVEQIIGRVNKLVGDEMRERRREPDSEPLADAQAGAA